MKYELETLESLVGDVVSGRSTPETMPGILKEEDRLPNAVTENIFKLSSEHLIRQYICWHLDGLVRLADKIYHKAQHAPAQELKKALVVVLNLLDALSRSFPEHLDNAIPLPKVILDRERGGLLDEMMALKGVLVKNKVSPRLTEIALVPLIEITARRHHKRVTCSAYHYLHRYVTALKSLDFKTTGYEVPDHVLADKLIGLNYNSLRMLEYCTAEINKYLKKHLAAEKKEKVLSTVKKILNQLPVMAGMCYDKRFSPIRDALVKWTDEELAFLVDVSGKYPIRNLQKLRLPVGQIALLAFLTHKHEVYFEKDKKAIIRHFIETYSSKETERISEGSFSNHFKKPTDTAARGLRKLLRQMLDDLDDFLKG